MAKYTVWVDTGNGYGARTEEADSAEEAVATVEQALEEPYKHYSFSEMADMIFSGAHHRVVGVEPYEDSVGRTTPENVRQAFGLKGRD